MHNVCNSPFSSTVNLFVGLILDKQIIYGSTTVQLIVLILNKQIIYGSTLDVQL